jgi:uncharacterized membrane protein YdjX (TVP38/TMEM64 family)
MKFLLPVGSACVAIAASASCGFASLFFSADDISSLMPPSPAARVAFALLLFLLQCVVPFLLYGPIVIACGMLFDSATAFLREHPRHRAFLVVPYLIGRCAPDAWVRARLEKYPRLKRLAGGEPEASFLFPTFYARWGSPTRHWGCSNGLARMPFSRFCSRAYWDRALHDRYLLLGRSWGIQSPWMWAAFS